MERDAAVFHDAIDGFLVGIRHIFLQTSAAQFSAISNLLSAVPWSMLPDKPTALG